MRRMDVFARKHPVTFAVVSTTAWLVSLAILMGIASGALRRPYGDGVSGTAARLAVTACLFLLMWHLGWLKSAGVLRLGSGRVWALAGGGVIYLAFASLYSFYGGVAFDASSLQRWPGSGSAIAAHAAAALSEEAQFRGLVLFVLARAWGITRQGLLGSVALTSVLFAALHMTQVFTYGVSLPSALLLTLQTCLVSFWWGALVVAGGSIWPAVMLHFVVNAVVAVQGLATPIAEPAVMGYALLLLFSAPLGALGLWMVGCDRRQAVSDGV